MTEHRWMLGSNDGRNVDIPERDKGRLRRSVGQKKEQDRLRVMVQIVSFAAKRCRRAQVQLHDRTGSRKPAATAKCKTQILAISLR